MKTAEDVREINDRVTTYARRHGLAQNKMLVAFWAWQALLDQSKNDVPEAWRSKFFIAFDAQFKGLQELSSAQNDMVEAFHELCEAVQEVLSENE